MLSEVLLQQTNVVKVIEPFVSISSRWPSVHALADADSIELRPYFADLGLFYRAERLVSISKQIVELHNGIYPSNKDDLLKVRGIGGYAASCIVCFGHGLREAIVDTNVIRIVSRVFHFQSEKARPRDDKKIWGFADKLLPQKYYVDYNYALLDFAAVICTYSNPRCDRCPLHDICSYKIGPE